MDVVSPRLRLELPDGTLHLLAGYGIQGAPTEFREGGKRYRGFAADGPVMLIGAVARGGVDPEVQAEFIFGGDKQTYIYTQQTNVVFLSAFGLLWTFMGIVFLIGLLRQARKD